MNRGRGCGGCTDRLGGGGGGLQQRHDDPRTLAAGPTPPHNPPALCSGAKRLLPDAARTPVTRSAPPRPAPGPPPPPAARASASKGTARGHQSALTLEFVPLVRPLDGPRPVRPGLREVLRLVVGQVPDAAQDLLLRVPELQRRALPPGQALGLQELGVVLQMSSAPAMRPDARRPDQCPRQRCQGPPPQRGGGGGGEGGCPEGAGDFATTVCGGRLAVSRRASWGCQATPEKKKGGGGRGRRARVRKNCCPPFVAKRLDFFDFERKKGFSVPKFSPRPWPEGVENGITRSTCGEIEHRTIGCAAARSMRVSSGQVRYKCTSPRERATH